MPSPPTTDLPRPTSWDELENIAADVLRERWRTPHVTRNGRNGQKQHGVDIYGPAAHLPPGDLAGAQCKRADVIRFEAIEECVHDAEAFEPTLAELLICTTAPRDATVQREVRLLDQKRARAGQFRVHVLWWEDLSLELSGHPRLLAKHFPNWSRLDAQDEVPVLSLRWDHDGMEMDAITLTAVPRSLLDLDAALILFDKEELDLDPKEVQRALVYNAKASEILADGSNRELWRKQKARDRYEEFGVKVGVKLANDRATAVDVLGTLTFPAGFELWEAGQRPSREEDEIKLPVRPTFGALGRYAQLVESMTWNIPRISIPEPMDELPKIRLLPSPFTVTGNEVTLGVKRLAPRRLLTFGGDDALTIVPPAESGECDVKWRVDAENLREPLEGVLKLIVK